MLCDLGVGNPEQVKVRGERIWAIFDHREDKIAVCHIEAWGENVWYFGLDVDGIPRFHSLDAVAEALCVLGVVISQEFVDTS
jgi:hypothetical protein